jgi:hypothetical protein
MVAPWLRAGLGLPAFGALVFLAVLAAGVACWVIGSGDRTERVSRVLLAWRGDPGCLPSGAPAAVAPSRRRPRRRPWPRGGERPVAEGVGTAYWRFRNTSISDLARG